MAARATPYWQRAGAWVLILVLCLTGGSVPARAQGSSQTHYFRARSFFVPFDLPASEQRNIQSVTLFVAAEGDRSYHKVASVGPAAGRFPFEAPHDGWYAFVVQTHMTSGVDFPARIDNATPGMRIYVDTRKPIVSLREAMPRQGTVAVSWSIADAYPDAQSLRLEYRPGGTGSWLPLYPSLTLQGQHEWDAGTNGPVEVRLQVRDRAGNQAEASTRVMPRSNRGGSYPPPAPSDPGRPSVIYVPSTTFKLNYTIGNIGDSGVKRVEVWYTQDPRGGWQKYEQDAPSRGPFTVKVKNEGRYGFTLVPYSGVDLAERTPQPGDEPRIWVEVDMTKPTVQITNVFVGQNENADKLVIWWKAEDLHLKERPIRISYRKRDDHDWTPFRDGQDLPNSGNATCQCKGLPYEFFVRIEALDEAGNVGADQWKETIKVDIKVPRIDNIQVLPDRTPSGGNGSMPNSQ